MAYTKIIGIKEKKFSHIRDLYPKPHKSHKINSQNSLGHLKRDLLVLENMVTESKYVQEMQQKLFLL